jgi:5'-nucleotidase
MRILLSNDDGIDAPGLAALRAAVAELGEVTVVAPANPQSAMGHAITLTHPLTVRRLRVAHVQAAFDGLSVDGRPADCVRLAIRNLLPSPPDLVLSGINAGANVGVNVFYSGTVAAAAEAAMFGIPAVAFSAGRRENEPPSPEGYTAVARWCRHVLDRLLERGLSGGDLFNVNVPPLDGPEDPRSPVVCVVPHSTSGVEDEYVLLSGADAEAAGAGEGEALFRLGEVYAHRPDPVETDVTRLAAGCITVTPLHVDMTHHARLRTMREDGWFAL